MVITRVASGEIEQVVISSVRDEDFKVLTKKRFFFSWKLFKGKADIYKLEILGEREILGVVAIKKYSEEARIQIELLACSIENKGKNKKFAGIIGCLIGFVCRTSLEAYGEFACVSLIPKTELKQHYINNYNMSDGGWQLFIDGYPLREIVKKYAYA